MEEIVAKFIKENKLLKPNSEIVLAVSGGIDSMALLYCLNRLGYKITVAHINHNVRKESYEEYDFVSDYAKELGCKFEGTVLPHITQGNFHLEARNLRYDFLFKVAKESKVLVTAHHLDDQVETILMKLCRGSNLYGYSGIKPKSVINGISVVRPFLSVTREDIKAYVIKNNIPYREDASNASDKYTRNRFRHHIIPLIKEENPNMYKGFMEFSNQATMAFDYIRGISSKYLKENQGSLDVNTYRNLDLVIQNDVLDLLLTNNHLEPSKAKIDEIRKMIINPKPNQESDLGSGYVLKKVYDKAYIKEKESDLKYTILVNCYGEYSLYNGKKLVFSENKPNNGEKYLRLCYNKITLPLCVRPRLDGDRIEYPFGTKKIKDLFIDKKIPMDERNLVPIVIDSNGTTLGIIGFGPAKCMLEVTNPCYLYIKE